ncbi:universal stress protein [Dyella sp.]|uniref:universal stress protein n=1 Tax=Dyella sp. TaxID=1869338 RepID=UPI002ED2F055
MTTQRAKPMGTSSLQGAAFAAAPVITGIVALVTSGAPWSAAATTAVNLAAAWRSSLTGCLLEPRSTQRRKSEPTVLSLLYETPGIRADASASGDFVAFALGKGVRQVHWRCVDEALPVLLSQLGNWHDLAVLEHALVKRAGITSHFGKALCATRMPCLILPSGDVSVSNFEQVALAWDGSDSATRAIYSALPVIARAKQVYVLDGSLETYRRHGAMPHFDPYLYLSQFGIKVHAHMIHTDACIGAPLLEEAAQLQTDVLVMGAYNHPRLEEHVRGGATRFVLEHATVPVWMRH